MIGSLRGTLAHRSTAGEVTVEVAGVGYRITVSPSTVAALGGVGAPAVVHTSLNVREDSLTLFGFPSREERDCFEALLGAHGVGPALALAILSVHRPAELRQVLASGDLDALTLVPGVGRKTAARLLIELKSRLDGFDLDDGALAELVGSAGNGDRHAAVLSEVRSALAGLGYEVDEIRHAMREITDLTDGSDDIQGLLKTALRVLAVRR